MKINYFLFVALFLFISVQAQEYNSNPSIDDANVSHRIHFLKDGKCPYYYYFKFDMPYIAKSYGNWSWGDKYYRYRVNIKFKDYRGNLVREQSVTLNPQTDYKIFSGRYHYSIPIYNPLSGWDYNTVQHDFIRTNIIEAEFKIISYIHNNDPGLSMYIPTSGYGNKTLTTGVFPSWDGNCDSVNDDRPDLTAQKSDILINSDCTTCQTQLSNLGSGRHILSRTGSMNISTLVKNIGNTSAASSKINYYLSIDSNLTSGDFKFPVSTNVSSLSPNYGNVVGQGLSGLDVNSALPYQNYTLIIKIDGDDQVTESSETNNIFKVPVTYRYSSTKIIPIGEEPIDPYGDMKSASIASKPYDLYIYNIYGQQIKKVTVKNKADEKYIIKELRRGFYIFNTENESRKIYIDK